MTNKQQLIKNYGLKALKIAVFAAAMFFINTAVNAQVEAGNQYQIIALHSNKCVDVSEVSTKSGQAVHQWNCLKSDNQNWLFEHKMAGKEVAYTIAARHSGKCLDVEGGKTANGTPVIQWDCNGGNNQLWIAKQVGDGYQLKSAQSGKCLDVRGPSVDDGAKMQIWDCGEGQKNQLFKLPLLATVANVERASFDNNPVIADSSITGNDRYKWNGGAPFERTIYNPLDGGVLLRYKQTEAQRNSDGCSNPLPDPVFKAFYQQACFAHDVNYDAPFQQAGFPSYESDKSSIGKDLADYLFLKDMLLINKNKSASLANTLGVKDASNLGETSAYVYFRAVQDFGGFRGDRGGREILEKGGVVAVKNYGVYTTRLRVMWTSPKGVRKVEEVLNVGGRAATIPLSAGSRDIEIEATAVGGKQIFKKSFPTVGMYAFTVGGTTLATNFVEGSLKADFGDKLTAFGNQVNTAFRGEKTAAGQRAIRFNHEAGYVADMTVLYFVNEKIGGTTVAMPKTQSTPKLTAGFARTLVIPNELAPNTNIQVIITGYGTIKNGSYTTTVPANFTGEICFKAYSDFGNPQYAKCN